MACHSRTARPGDGSLVVKRVAPAAARNAGPIAEVLELELPAEGTVLEIASGTGEHAVFMTRRFPRLVWQPTDLDRDNLASIAAWRDEADVPNLAPPIVLDAAASVWPIWQADAVFCCNMIHISPWAATEGLFAGAARLLHEGQPLCLYGPFLEAGVETAPSNLAFDRSLKERDPRWGLRHLSRLDALAQLRGFTPSARHAMPANNIMRIYRRTLAP